MFGQKPNGGKAKVPLRRDGRIIIHFDYDCFYAACFEVERPQLRSLPLAVQQKHIIVTCNYEARKRGLYKLQLISEARKACPEVIIILGEDLTRFRNNSKSLYNFLRQRIWSGRAERLGFDEVWLDVTDMIDSNVALLNPNQLEQSWFCLDKLDPTRGFSFDASKIAGSTQPCNSTTHIFASLNDTELDLRLLLGSHLAFHLRKQLEEELGFTSTVGISTNKELSKLVGNVHKPKGQTTLLPPYTQNGEYSNVIHFLDEHEIGRIPGIGYKGARKIRTLIKGHDVGYEEGLVIEFTKEKVSVRQVRDFPGMGPELLEATLGGVGAPKGIGGKVWELLHGVDDSEVSRARDVPKQISIEDTYLHLHDLQAARQQLVQLSASLIKRLRLDLTEDDAVGEVGFENDGHSRTESSDPPSIRRWLVHPRTIRLSTRERQTHRSFSRTSRSSIMPSFVFNTDQPVELLATKLVDEKLLPMFSKVIPARPGFDVNLINVAATNMQESAGERESAGGRDISKMFRTQEKVLSEWRVKDRDVPPDEPPLQDDVSQFGGAGANASDMEKDVTETVSDVSLACGESHESVGSEDILIQSQATTAGDGDDMWDSDTDQAHSTSEPCSTCGAVMPLFAVEAHTRFHCGD